MKLVRDDPESNKRYTLIVLSYALVTVTFDTDFGSNERLSGTAERGSLLERTSSGMPPRYSTLTASELTHSKEYLYGVSAPLEEGFDVS